MAKHAPSSGPGTIEHLAQWVLAPRAQDVPEPAVRQAKLLLLDTIGCGYAALDQESARAVLATLADLGGAACCSVIGGAPKTSAPNAVLVNGALIRILDLNDYVNNRKGEIGGHPSDNIPVALAAGEMCGSRPLADAVTSSTGIGPRLSGSASCNALAFAFTASMSAGFSGPKFEAVEAKPL